MLVTRPARQAGEFARKLAALDARPVVFPAIVILPPADRTALDAAHAQLDEYDLAFFVSANAAEYGAPPDPARWPPRLMTFAPGPGTAEALAAVGLANVHAPPARFDSEGLLALPELADVRGKRAVIFCGERGRDLVTTTLTARGARVDNVACYRRARPASGAAGMIEALREGRVDAVTITSSEGLDNLMHVLGKEGRPHFLARPMFVPHARIADHARTLGAHPIQTAGGDAGVIAGLLEWAANRQPTR